MTHPDRAKDYLEHIAEAIGRAMRYVGSLTNLEALEKDELAQDAIVRTIAVIGEAANRIQKVAPEFVAKHPEIPWSKNARHSQQSDPRLFRRCLGCRLGHGEERSAATVGASQIPVGKAQGLIP
jgi:hypothetical protein